MNTGALIAGETSRNGFRAGVKQNESGAHSVERKTLNGWFRRLHPQPQPARRLRVDRGHFVEAEFVEAVGFCKSMDIKKAEGSRLRLLFV